ncbi:uncharacterized protein SPSK_00354 [Sporothrix schenckii 1099-18]|uniref:Uncharacterized protein n=1 Tax=Sporothrix schenckii 1099-18 TaxID=1397361 RepID=A0A0F2M4H0_SPOSC|nr:uncharacterized protein SPSK_00354 [Sporothrix schenckii 1099-18]KJR83979.1 hypothetical protein SPSK_00354 [Sporothrix schenckii 1099-18]
MPGDGPSIIGSVTTEERRRRSWFLCEPDPISGPGNEAMSWQESDDGQFVVFALSWTEETEMLSWKMTRRIPGILEWWQSSEPRPALSRDQHNGRLR